MYSAWYRVDTWLMVATIIVAGAKIRTEFQLSLGLRDLPLLVAFRETDGQKYIQSAGRQMDKKA